MSGSFLGIAVELLVAVLLVVAIGYCVIVNRKLEGIRSDKSELRAIIRDLYTATQHAEQAIGTLRDTAGTLEETLGDQIARGQKIETQLAVDIERGEGVLSKLAVVAGKGPAASAPSRNRPGPVARAPLNVRHSELGLGLLNSQQREIAKDVA